VAPPFLKFWVEVKKKKSISQEHLQIQSIVFFNPLSLVDALLSQVLLSPEKRTKRSP
jgi:hypothetical protein